MPLGAVFAVGKLVEGGALVTFEHTHADGGKVYDGFLFVLEEGLGVHGKIFAILGQTVFYEILLAYRANTHTDVFQ